MDKEKITTTASPLPRYFDWTATTPISEGALAEYLASSREYFANPSSTHSLGTLCRGKLEECRHRFARLLKTQSSFIYFTSGGTESNAIILNSLLQNPTKSLTTGDDNVLSKKEIICSAIEHPAILQHKNILQSYGYKFTSIPCPKGFIDLDKLRQALNPSVKMVCIMTVNNVTGTVQPLSEAVKIIRDYSATTSKHIHIHSDAVQAGGKMPFYPELLDLDSASFSAHKFYGPKGTGLLYCRNKNIQSLSKAGGQEKGLRGGTENIPGLSSMLYALEDALSNADAHAVYVEKLRLYLERRLVKAGFEVLSPSGESGNSEVHASAVVSTPACNGAYSELTDTSSAAYNGFSSMAADAFEVEKTPAMFEQKNYTPYILCVSPGGIPSEVFLRVMNDKGFCLSASSACSASSKAKAESILTAMGYGPKQRMSSIRISLSHLNTEEEVSQLATAMIETKKQLKGV